MTSFEEYKRAVARGHEPVTHDTVVIPREARDFQGMRAGIISRLIANAIDLAIAAGIVLAAYVGWAGLKFAYNPVSFTWPSAQLILIFGGVLVTLGFEFWVLWATTGRTYGDHVMGLRVVNFRGERLRWFGALVRAAFCVVFMLGLLWVAVSHQNRSVQDVVLRTSVIYDWQPRAKGRARLAPTQ